MKEIKFSGNLRSLDPKRLVDKEEDKAIESFFLVLGIFYNDLKSLTFYFVQLGNAFDDLDKYEVVATKEFGEYHGIKSHLDRLLAGTLSEFFKFVKQNKSVLDHLWFKSAYNSLNLDLRSRWDLIVEIATGSQVSDESDFASVLLLIRNNLSFHYFQSAKRMRAGFVKHFFDDPKTPANDKAYYSTGETMEDTRFFFFGCSKYSGHTVGN